MSNSSFSWWAAYLNKRNSIIICPQKWFRGMDDKNAADTGAHAENGVDDQEINEATTWQEKVDLLNKRKQDLRNKYAVIERKDIEHAVYSNGGGINGNSYDLTRERPQEYSSEGLFGNLRYEDLKKAHTETVIPVTDEDYHNAKKFRNVNELQTFRDLSRREFRINEAEQQHTYDKTRLLQEEEDTRRAFILAKQAEISRDIHKKLYSDMFRLE
jgi:hypothetical protein